MTTERERQRQKERVLTIFEAHREAPGQPIDESHFLDFLLASPEKNRAVYESVAGLKRLNAFFDQLQLEYSVCFLQAERAANYPLDTFVAKTAALAGTPRTSLTTHLVEVQKMYSWPVAGVANIVLLLAALPLLDTPWLLALLGAFMLVVNGVWLWSRRNYAQYRRQLYRQLMAAIALQRKQATKREYDALS